MNPITSKVMDIPSGKLDAPKLVSSQALPALDESISKISSQVLICKKEIITIDRSIQKIHWIKRGFFWFLDKSIILRKIYVFCSNLLKMPRIEYFDLQDNKRQAKARLANAISDQVDIASRSMELLSQDLLDHTKKMVEGQIDVQRAKRNPKIISVIKRSLIGISQEANKIVELYKKRQSLIHDAITYLNDDSQPALSFRQSVQKLTNNISSYQKTEANSLKPGNFKHEGMTCFVATGLQIINSLSAYKNFFDPQINPLQQRSGESDVDFATRQELQVFVQRLLRELESSSPSIPGAKEVLIKMTQIAVNKAKYLTPSNRVIQNDASEFIADLMGAMGVDAPSIAIRQTHELLPGSESLLSYVGSGNLSLYDEFIEPKNIEVSQFSVFPRGGSLPNLLRNSLFHPNDVVEAKYLKINDDQEIAVHQAQFKRTNVLVGDYPDLLKINVERMAGFETIPLDVPLIFTPPNSSSRYQLVAAGFKTGDQTGGHWTAISKHNDRFVYADDLGGVTVLTDDQAIKKIQKASFFYYEKIKDNSEVASFAEAF